MIVLETQPLFREEAQVPGTGHVQALLEPILAHRYPCEKAWNDSIMPWSEQIREKFLKDQWVMQD